MKIPALPLSLFLLAGLAACAGDERFAEQAERLTVEEETIALSGALSPAAPEPSPGRAALVGEVGVAPVAIRPGSIPLEAEAVEGGLRRSLDRADLLAEDGGLLSEPDPDYRLALNIENLNIEGLDVTGTEGQGAQSAELSVRYILLDRNGRVVWSETMDTAGTAPAASAAPVRDAAEEAMRESIRRMLGSLDRGA
ncbi:hypothetical protein [Azospirillum sp. SYSU D00513]|uniref:hypothetical protein n=1 Tax=Azospirillum sp. SYSU D00513 TaxID=2812561 RepID=UPI001A979328|nr:hypothetical protein [Azospirillum sp. SYSU D00513]